MKTLREFFHIKYIGNIAIGIIPNIGIVYMNKKVEKSGISFSGGTLNTIIKNIIQRPRPDHLRLIKQGGYSFPSGHSMIAVCVYGTLIYLVHKKVKNKKIKILLEVLLTLLILLIGISRIYVGVHYPSDVLTGYLISIIILIVNISALEKQFRGN